MALDSAMHAFFDEIRLGNFSRFAHVIQDTMRDIIGSHSRRHLNDSHCLLQHSGDFLLAVLESLLQFIEVFIKESHLPQYIRHQLQNCVKEHDLTDLSDAKYLNKKYNSLLCV